jgi:hypothetical protein
MPTTLIPADKFDTFKRQARELFNAGWTNLRVAKWAAMPEAFGHYVTEKEALPLVNDILREMNAEIQRQNEIIRQHAIEGIREILDLVPHLGITARNRSRKR